MKNIISAVVILLAAAASGMSQTTPPLQGRARPEIVIAAVGLSADTDVSLSAAHSPSSSRQPATIANFVVKIRGGNLFVGGGWGHGICLDSPCRHVLTNYHVGGLLSDVHVEGIGVKSAQFGTGPEDDGAVPINALGGVHSWNPQRDLALLTLKHELPSRFVAAEFAEETPQPGMDVVRYPTAGDVYRGKLTNIGAVLYQDSNAVQHEMKQALLTDFDSPLGVSGGALCDGAGRVIGVTEFHNRSIAIPLTVVSEFLRGANPVLWSRLRFDKLSTENAQSDATAEIPAVIVSMTEDPKNAVASLVGEAGSMREQMIRVVAQSEMRRSGPLVRSQPERYEVALLESGLRFRRMLPNGQLGAETNDIPLPEHGIVPGADWDYLLSGLAGASIQYDGETLLNDQIAHRFRFTGLACPFREQRPTGLWSGSVECQGEVLTDLSFHPLLVKANFVFGPYSILARMHMEVSFQLTDLTANSMLYLPTTILIEAKYKGCFGTYKATNTFADYRLFRSDHVIRPETEVAGSTE